jgi:hypothetical protein
VVLETSGTLSIKLILSAFVSMTMTCKLYHAAVLKILYFSRHNTVYQKATW